MFIDRPMTENDIYAKLLSNKLPANLGYLYENLVAQMIAASGRELYYHTWGKKGKYTLLWGGFPGFRRMQNKCISIVTTDTISKSEIVNAQAMYSNTMGNYNLL